MRLQAQHPGGCPNLVLQSKSQSTSGALHLCSTESAGSHSNKSNFLLGTCLYVSWFWHWTMLNISGHPSYIFLPTNGTGMLQFNTKRSQVAVTSPVIPARLSWPPFFASCPRDGVAPGEVEPEYFHVFGTTLRLHLPSCTMGLRITSFFPEEADLNVMAQPQALGMFPLKYNCLVVRNINKWDHWLLPFFFFKWSVCCFRVSDHSPHSLYAVILGTKHRL